MNTSICTKCGRQFQMGLDGICNPVDLCDDCAGVQRDADGNAWEPDEQEHHYQNVKTGERTTVKRSEAIP